MWNIPTESPAGWDDSYWFRDSPGQIHHKNVMALVPFSRMASISSAGWCPHQHGESWRLRPVALEWFVADSKG